MKRAILVVVAMAAVGVGCWWAIQRQPSLPFFPASSSANAEGTPVDAADDDLAAPDPTRVVALGWLEPAGGVIEVGATVGDRLESLEVAVGDLVEKGQPLAYLESRAVRREELASLEAQLAEAGYRLAAERGLADARIAAAAPAVEQAKLIDLEIKAQRTQIEALQAAVEVARNDSQRLSELPDDLVSAQERDRQKLVVEQCQAELTAAQAVLEKLTRGGELSLAAAQAELEAIKSAKDQVLAAVPLESLKKRRDLAKTQWEQTAVLAPSKGAVLKVFAQPGETIGPTPILYMADLSRMTAIAEVYETDVKRICVGQRVKITSKAFRPRYDRQGLQGVVSHIGQMFAVPKLESFDPLERADRHVVEVTIDLDEASSKEAARFVNLQVDATFLAES